MAASSVTGTGPGSAFPGNTLPNLEFLIREEITKVMNRTWEVFFTRYVPSTAPNDGDGVDTGFTLSPDKDYLFGVVLNAADVPITDLRVITAGFILMQNPSGTVEGAISFAPDGGETQVLIHAGNGCISRIERGFVWPHCCVPEPVYCKVGNSSFRSTVDDPTKLLTRFGDTGSSAYFIGFWK